MRCLVWKNYQADKTAKVSKGVGKRKTREEEKTAT